jgi:DNA invertase Pin-like site-specific DNA recombinase
MNVFGYCRVSGKSQVEGDGFPRQEAAIESFCKIHNLKLCYIAREEGVSGTVEGLDRPTFAEMIQRIEDPNTGHYPIHAIVVERMDRLARDLMVSEVLLGELRKRNIKIFSTDQGALIDMASDGGDPTRVLIRQIMGALSQWEKSMLVKKLRAAKDRLKVQGKYAEGNRPYGIFPGEETILKFLLDNHPAINYCQLAKMLQSSGCLTRSGRDWKPQNVRQVLTWNRKSKK